MKLWGLLIGAAAIAACGSADDSDDLFGQKVCVPGATAECACPGGAKGAQACRDDGSGYAACACGGGPGSGGSAGSEGAAGASGAGAAGVSGTGGGGTGGAGGSCTPRSMCPAPEADGGAPLCGMLDDYCGGKLSCGCDFGECAGSACSCWRLPQWDAACAAWSGGANGNLAVQCLGTYKPVGNCGSGPQSVPELGFPWGAKCCK